MASQYLVVSGPQGGPYGSPALAGSRAEAMQTAETLENNGLFCLVYCLWQADYATDPDYQP